MITLIKKIKKNLSNRKRERRFTLLSKKENDYSNSIALAGFSEKEEETILWLLQRVRKNIEKDWELVKKGNKRNY